MHPIDQSVSCVTSNRWRLAIASETQFGVDRRRARWSGALREIDEELAELVGGLHHHAVTHVFQRHKTRIGNLGRQHMTGGQTAGSGRGRPRGSVRGRRPSGGSPGSPRSPQRVGTARIPARPYGEGSPLPTTLRPQRMALASIVPLPDALDRNHRSPTGLRWYR
jgi:hypothetical protein